MKKILLTGAALSAALIAGQANAVLYVSPANVIPDITAMRAAGLAEAQLAGASAPTPMIEKAFLNNCLNGAGQRVKYSNGTNHFVWVCDNANTIATLPAATFPYLMLQKRDAGGSITGVVAALPVGGTYAPTSQDYGKAPMFTDAQLLAATACTGTVCTLPNLANGPSNPTPTANFADVDAAKFEAGINGLVANAGSLASSSVATQVFGVAVNLKLYRAMQQAMVNVGVANGGLPASCAPTAGVQDESEACMPSLTTEQLSSIFGKDRVTDWRNLRYGSANLTQFLTLALPAGDVAVANRDIHVCQRTKGSGTLATQHLKFHNAPCFSLAEPMDSASLQTVGAETATTGAVKVLHSLSGSGDVDNCLVTFNDGLNTGTFTPYNQAPQKMFPDSATPGVANPAAVRWAIGFLSVDRNDTNAKPYRYIKIDNYAPTLKNVVAGRYKVWAELTQVGNVNPLPTADSVLLANDIIANMKNADQLPTLNKTYAWGVSGFLGIASSSTFPPSFNTAINGLFNAGYDAARPVNPYSHAVAASVNGSGTDHCRVPTIPGGARAIPVFYN
jgi:ABC-type phosphate transport system substrate-binding protein